MTDAIDTEVHDTFAVNLYYDECAENPQHWYDHASVFVPFDRRSYWKRSTLADQVPATYRGADDRTIDVADLDPDCYADNYADADDPDSFTGYADWCADMIATFGPGAHVAFVAYEDYGANGARVYLAGDPLPLLDTEASWRAIVDPDSGLTADGCIVVSPSTAPGTAIDRYAAIVKGDCAELTAYLSGQCYYWTVTDTTTGDVLEAVGGYYDADEALAAARDEADCYVADRTATLAWLRAEADWQLTIPDVATMCAAQRRLWTLDELEDPDYEPV